MVASSGPRPQHRRIYSATDLTLSSPSLQENAHAPLLTLKDVVTYVGHYLGDVDPRDPRASPLLAPHLAGVAPALIQVAERDPLRDDGLRYADSLRAAGVTVRATTCIGMPHGYLSTPRPCRSSEQALHEICAELGHVFDR